MISRFEIKAYLTELFFFSLVLIPIGFIGGVLYLAWVVAWSW